MAKFISPSGSTPIDVSNFGAVGDGLTDDTQAIQNAINSASAAGGGVVYFPGGTYLLDSYTQSTHPWYFYNLLCGSNVLLEGEFGGGVKLLQGANGRAPVEIGRASCRERVCLYV